MPDLKLSELGFSELKADEGKFRSVVHADSIPYQIGSDSSTFEEAQQKCIESMRPLSLMNVYDDEGRSLPLAGVEYHSALDKALSAQSRVTSAEEALTQAKKDRDLERTTVREMLKPYIGQALKKFETEFGTRISLDDKGITPHKQGVNLDVRMFRKGGGEFDEEFDNKKDLEDSITKKLRKILKEVFHENGLPLTLGEITVPVHYWVK